MYDAEPVERIYHDEIVSERKLASGVGMKSAHVWVPEYYELK